MGAAACLAASTVAAHDPAVTPQRRARPPQRHAAPDTALCPLTVRRTALDDIAEEVNELLQEAGTIDTAGLCKQFNLPSEFLMPHLSARMGSIILGTLDSGVGRMFTEAYVARQTARIRGVFRAITKPVSTNAVAQQHSFQPQLVKGPSRGGACPCAWRPCGRRCPGPL